MIESMRVRSFLVFALLFFSAIYLLPNFVSLPKGWWFYQKKLNYGLDIQGGAHLVYGVDVAGVLHDRTERMARTIAIEMKDKGVEVDGTVSDDKNSLIIKAKNEVDKSKVSQLLKDNYSTILQITSDSGNNIEAKYFDATIEEYRSQVVHQAIEVIRNRVDEFGVAEPVIAAQGKDRILVQLPGIADSAQAKTLINKTARLTFRLVDTTFPPEKVAELVATAEKEGDFALGKDGMTYAQYYKRINEALKGKLPPNSLIAFEKAPQATTMDSGKVPLILKTDSGVSGDLLEDAFLTPGQYGEPEVAFRFGSEGQKQFGELTENNVNRQLAIVLDDVVYSAPSIKTRIDREGRITLGNRNYEEGQKEATLIATTLRAGALPAALQQLEERTVGPSLGLDSIKKGQRAGVIGMLLVVAFVVFYYKAVGVVASICLGLNVIVLLALLSALGATLTLPGIAGIVLTVGMAIDANVIIFERIKEELARGASMKSAIREGFDRAWSAIFDSNVTNAIAAAVLIYFGSGPVRGFGVTLIAGIVTTMITAVFVSHYILDLMVRKPNAKISI